MAHSTSSQKPVVIVLGADRIEGICGMFSQVAALAGWVVIDVGLKDSGNALAQLVRSSGGECLFYQGDACNLDFIRQTVAAVFERYGRVDAIVVGAAFAPAGDTLSAVSEPAVKDAAWRNIGPAYNAVQAVIPVMTRQGYGRIVFIGTANTVAGQYGQPLYASAKAGLVTLMKYATARYARFGIQVNMASPSTTPNDGDSWDERRSRWGPDLESGLAWLTPSRRLNTPADVARVIFFLASDQCPLFGQEIKIDGGASAAGGPLGGDDWHAEVVRLWRRVNGEPRG